MWWCRGPDGPRCRVFDFVEFLAARCGVSQPQPQSDWTDAEFAELAMRQALRGIEDDEIVYGREDIKESWR